MFGDEFQISVKENAPAVSALAVNNSGILDVAEAVNYAVLVFVLIQICYTVWKWVRDYRAVKSRCKDNDLLEED